MKIKQVKIKNFRGYGINKNSSDEFFTFDDLDKYNVIILSGYNGYGKTSFYDAIEWCITDKIQRLLELDSVFKLGKNYLKSSEYLKFNGGKLNNGLVEVAITFIDGDNEYFIKRTTYCNNFQDLGYNSQCYNIYDDKMNNEEIKELISIISQNFNEDSIKNNFMKSNVLGQERMNEFLRLTKPEQRTKGIFNLVGLNNITDILQLSKSEKISNAKSVLTEIGTKKNQFLNAKDTIENWFKIKGFGDFESYFEKVKNDILEINNDLKLQQITFRSFKLEENLDENNVLKTVDDYIKCNETVQKYYLKTKENFDIALKKWYLTRIDENIDKLHTIHLAKQFDVITLRSKMIDSIKFHKYYIDILKKSEIQTHVLRKYISISKDDSYIIGFDKDNIGKIDYTRIEETLETINQFYSKYSENITYGIIKNKRKIDMIIRENWDNKVNLVNTQVSEVLNKIRDINHKRQIYNKLSKNTSNYNEVFGLVKEIIIKEKLEYCPICKNEVFPNNINNNYEDIINVDNNTKLLQIIDNTISDGKEELLLLQEEITNEIKSIENLKERLSVEIDNMLGILNSVKKLAVSDFKSLSNYIKLQLNCIEKHTEYYNSCEINYRKKLEEYDTYIKKIKISFKINNLTDEKLLNVSEVQYTKLVEHYKQVVRKKYGVIIKGEESLKEIINLIVCDNTPAKMIKDLSNCNKTMKCFKNLLDYKIDDEERRKFKEFIELRDKIDNINYIYNRMDELIKCYDNIGSQARTVETTLIDKLVKDNPLSTWIYEHINPHPLYSKFKFKISGNDTNIVYEKNESIYLDHIFSSAQLNVLALSIFLGFALMKGSSNIDQLFLDDPIQNMDDYNILSLIDVFRAITDKKINKSIIISTHDDNFKNLLAIKFRNKKCKVFSYNEYDEYGPIISESN